MNDVEKQVEFRLVNDDDLPPLIIKRDEHSNNPIVIINGQYIIWLSLMRNCIPGITSSLHEKLNDMCDSHLLQQLAFEQYEDE